MQTVTWSPSLGQAVRALKKQANRSDGKWRESFCLSSEESAILTSVFSGEKESEKKILKSTGSWV